MKSLEWTRFPKLDYSCAEAINTLSTNLTFAGNSIKRIMVTSCRPSEGKSFIAMNLMRTLAGIGNRVILVDADLRRSMLASRYGVRTSRSIVGLSHYLAGMCTMEDVVYNTDIENAHVVLAGHDVANSLPLLTTPRLNEMLTLFSQSYDIVLVDAPPVGTIIDAAQIARSCDGTLFVVSDNFVGRRELYDAVQQIETTGCPILGAVLNKVAFNSSSAKKYYYKTYYTHYGTGYYMNGRRWRKKKQSVPKKHHVPMKKGPK